MNELLGSAKLFIALVVLASIVLACVFAEADRRARASGDKGAFEFAKYGFFLGVCGYAYIIDSGHAHFSDVNLAVVVIGTMLSCLVVYWFRHGGKRQ